ncbi:C5a anaphylatoxin chemotactic receptor 1 [Alosa pseudoharengus]|uniref:C5a anaphylatoxin chemotactic receptor 1 n=1 Tax=Alosa pseudoharengus TaxID=34774 RepID=UPI003F89AC7D
MEHWNTSLLDYDPSDYNDTDVLTDITGTDVLGMNHIISLVCYALVFIIGVPGNALVAYVTAFRMPRSVNALWFLNLALTDLLCCLSLPLLMIPLAQDMHWSMGPLACKLLHGTFFLVMYCSVLQLALISMDRWMLVSWPVWCQNWRRPRYAYWACLGIWMLALLGSAPQFAIQEAVEPKLIFGGVSEKVRCMPVLHSMTAAWAITIFRFMMGFALPFMVICVSHWRVYQRASGRGQSRGGRERSARAARVIIAVVLTFFLCWAPVHVLDIVHLALPADHHIHHGHKLALANVLATCLAYVNSCLNPVIYVCMGRGFKEGIIRTLRSVLHLASEAPTHSMGGTQNSKSTSANTLDRSV